MTNITQNLPIIVIHLERSKDRRAFMKQQLQNFDLKYEIFPATDGHNLSPSDKALYSEKKAWQLRRPMSNPEIGCALSHIRLYEKIVQERIPETLILEDDVIFCKNFFPIIFQRAAWAPKDWKIIHFNDTNEKKYKTITGPFFHYYYIDSQKIYSVHRYMCKHYGAYAYIAKLEACEYLLKHAYPICRLSDTLLGAHSYKKLPTYTLFPQPCTYRKDTTSNIQNENFRTYIHSINKISRFFIKCINLLFLKITTLQEIYILLKRAKLYLWMRFVGQSLIKNTWKPQHIHLPKE